MIYDIFKKKKKAVSTCGHIWKVKLVNGEDENKSHIFHRCIRFRNHMTNHICSCKTRAKV